MSAQQKQRIAAKASAVVSAFIQPVGNSLVRCTVSITRPGIDLAVQSEAAEFLAQVMQIAANAFTPGISINLTPMSEEDFRRRGGIMRPPSHSVWSTTFICSAFMRPPCTLICETAESSSRRSSGVS
jgi:hypothetical protein